MGTRDGVATGVDFGMRVFVYSPVVLFGEGIASFLRSIESIRAVCVEHEGIEVESAVVDFRPDVVTLDVTRSEAFSIARSVKALQPEVVMVAMAVTEMAEEVIACADAGFSAYIPRNAGVDQMVAILNLAMEGGTVCAPQIARSLFDELARRCPVISLPAQRDEYLTPREVEIALLMARGAANKEIAEELHLSVATIKNHVHSVLRKLHTERRAEVARAMLEEPGLRQVPDHKSS
jgi:DNA-binding NarL/FixJ family response regulator